MCTVFDQGIDYPSGYLYRIHYIIDSMLSKAHPYSNLFETIEHIPKNYIQAVQDLTFRSLLDPPEVSDVIGKDNNPSFGNKFMKLDLSRITEESLTRYKSAFYQLGVFARKRNVQVSFTGLEEYKSAYRKNMCCSWFSQHKKDPDTNARLEIISLLAGVESQANPSKNRWIIELTEGL